MRNIVSCVLLLLSAFTVHTYKYDVFVENEDLLTPCKGKAFITEILSLKNLHLEFISDDEIEIYGQIEFVGDFDQNDKILAKFEVEKLERGQWAQTVYSVRRGDLCSAFFSPTDFWYEFAKNIPQSERICPPTKGRNYTVNYFTLKPQIIMPDPFLQGQYKIVGNYIQVDGNSIMKSEFCTELHFRVYKVGGVY